MLDLLVLSGSAGEGDTQPTAWGAGALPARQITGEGQLKTTMQIHEDSQIGLTMNGTVVREVSNGLGGTCWIATAKIGSIFGSEVEGECKGIGRTHEQALERLRDDQQKLAESLWA